MKFTQKLNTHLTPEWRQQYISYADLKTLILNAVEQSSLKEFTSDSLTNIFLKDFEEEFFFECEKELRKINNFYAEKIAEAKRRNELLSTALYLICGDNNLHSMSLQVVHRREALKKKIKIADLKNALSELYLSLVLLENYKMLNYTGFKKILKKHDKLLNTDKGKKWFEENISAAYFFKDNELERFMEVVENNFTDYLENGDRSQAMKRLRVPPLGEIQYVGTVFRVGLFLAFVGNLQSNFQSFKVHHLILFRGPFYVIMYLFLLAMNVYGWRRTGVNHILIFEINPRRHLTYTQLLELQSILGLLWGFCVCGYFYIEQINMPKLLLPLLLSVIMLMFFLNPFPILYRDARYWLLKVMGRVVLSPLYAVGVADFWLGDQLNSMVPCILDFKYLLCFYVNNTSLKEEYKSQQCLEEDYIGNAIVRCLPAWFRFAQCLRRYCDTGQAFPFLVNALKYATTFPMVIFSTLNAKYYNNYEHVFQSPFLWLYLVSAILNAFYCSCYDILRDFGLFRTFSGKNAFLREHIIYHPAFYYFAIVENVVLRFFWVISLCLVTHDYVSTHNMDSLAGCLEIIRRYIWNYLRLENEHLFNVGQFRAVRDIFIAPLSTKSKVELQRMMDEKDGVFNRNSSVSQDANVTDAEEDS